ncbi:MAG: DNA polymerase IV, partial [Clostridiales bacterium]|nr:DNA polymerase IV [Clostridiales bacterium]
MEKTILHCDLNNFYASVEERKDPSLKGKPIAVCGNPELRHGIILAKNQIAKSFGVKTAETIWQAKQKCPGLILLPASYNDYHQASKEVKQIYLSYTDYVESFGLDECWLDVTSSVSLFGDG